MYRLKRKGASGKRMKVARSSGQENKQIKAKPDVKQNKESGGLDLE